MRPYIFFSILIMLLVFQRCKKQEKCPEIFLLPASISPHKPTYKVGDTIEVVSMFHYMLPGYHQDDATRERKKVGDFDMRGIVWHPGASVYRIDSLFMHSEYSLIGSNFAFLQQTNGFGPFQYSESGVRLTGEYEYANDTFQLSFKLICQSTGTYFFEIGSRNFGRRAQPFEGWCRRLTYDTKYVMNEYQNNNIDFLRESPDSHWNEWILLDPQGRFHDFGGYCFKVEPR